MYVPIITCGQLRPQLITTLLQQARHRRWVDAVDEAVTAGDRARSARAP
jgi:hypothetical protein